MKKTLLLTGALTLFSMMASAKTYDVVLSGPTQAGNVQLKAGEYRVKLEGANARFTDTQTDKSIMVPVKVKQAPQKFENTAVDTNKKSGTDKIQTIELGGSNTQLDFGGE
jgi:hypothetical protein